MFPMLFTNKVDRKVKDIMLKSINKTIKKSKKIHITQNKMDNYKKNMETLNPCCPTSPISASSESYNSYPSMIWAQKYLELQYEKNNMIEEEEKTTMI
tara:strand:- start:482 stop:775 length:294 start_codon:yes stop_codon:yes gene_type:complete